MDKPITNISDLTSKHLVGELGLSRSYSSELLNRHRTPSLAVAVRIERAFGIPAATWVEPQDVAA